LQEDKNINDDIFSLVSSDINQKYYLATHLAQKDENSREILWIAHRFFFYLLSFQSKQSYDQRYYGRCFSNSS